MRSVLKRSPIRRLSWWVMVTAACVLALPALAAAHLERPSYWPDPAPDTSVSPAGRRRGARRRARSRRRSAARARATSSSSARATTARSRSPLLEVDRCRQATTKGFQLRPSQPTTKLLARARRTQPARDQPRAGAAVRVRLGPGRRLRRRQQRPRRDHARPLHRAASRAARRRNDPTCDPSLLQEDASGDLTPSYEYQVTCPNDQNLIYVQGRAVVGEPLEPPLVEPRRASRPRSSARACAATCRSRAPASSPRT